ncbi:hypothetical protein FA13DRAFT_1713554 [Coprinellus micaceus]|uniref:Uncharacterized protein n=1 Tax=Coprinellus micaceus TaxID=71717 RepID=A0A4Y7SWB9_COPMI|nr:hypothetical protein FA13DRAFT_1713554 [Coprinellus micaceus]
MPPNLRFPSLSNGPFTSIHPHIEALIPRIQENYESHSTAVLDALLKNLKISNQKRFDVRNPRTTTAGMMSMSALCEVHRWYMIHPTQTPLTIATSLRLFSAADDDLSWAQVTVCDGLVIMYADGMQNPKATRDSGMVVFRELTKDNPEGMAKAIMDAGVCTPQVFVECTMDRALTSADLVPSGMLPYGMRKVIPLGSWSG